MKHALLCATIVAALSFSSFAIAQDSTDKNGWTGTGELGLAVARGNSRSENVNAKIAFQNEDDEWKHKFSASILRAKGEVTGDFDGDGTTEERFELNANRFQMGASSALKMSEFSYWIAALRYEKDDFATFEQQTTFSMGYGHSFIKTERTELSAEVGPGYRRAKLASTGETESDAIARGVVDYKYSLTDTTDLSNNLLVEAGQDNTYIQNDLGIAVKINASFALKAGLQARYNTDVSAGQENTDTLTTVNLVYNFK